MKLPPVEAELFHVDGRTDRCTYRHDKANTSFSQLSERTLKKVGLCSDKPYNYYRGRGGLPENAPEDSS
jgi:hypothetical protein